MSRSLKRNLHKDVLLPLMAATFLCMSLSSDLLAQSGDGTGYEGEEQVSKAINLERFEPIDVDKIPSVLFTYWEQVEMNDARSEIGFVSAPTNEEINYEDTTEDAGLKVKPPPEERYIRLGGIVYKSPDDWIIWLNGQQVRPKALPKDVLSLNVYKDYVEMKWFDKYSNQIIPIRLRPQERFNIDTRIFLPGSGS